MITLPNFKKRQSTEAERSSLATGYNPTYDGASLEALVTRAEAAIEQLKSLDTLAERAAELGTMQERITGLEESLSAIEQVAGQLTTIEERHAALTEAQERTTGRIDEANAGFDQARESSEALMARIDEAAAMRPLIDQVLEMEPQFSSLRRDAEGLGVQLKDLGENVNRLRTVHDDAMHAQKHAATRLDGIEQRSQAASAKMDAVERRAGTAEDALNSLMRMANEIPDAQHQLGVLKAIAEQVAQKTASLEQQREAIERTAAQVAEVLALRPQLESALKRQEEHTQAVNALESKLAAVQSLHATVQSRGEEISAQQKKLEEVGQSAEQTLSGLRDEMKASAERFELENRSLDSVSERIVELRTGVRDCETRLTTLDQSSRTLAELEARSRTLATQVSTTSEDVQVIMAQADRLRAVRDDVGDLDRSLTEMMQRMERAESMRATVDGILRDITALNGMHESIRDGLEQVRVSYAEMTRLRERQAETDQWLAGSESRLRELRDLVTELEQTRPGTETLREKVDQLLESMDTVDARSGMVDALHRRLGELDSTLAQAQDRGDSLRARMDAAETRFTDLLRQAAEARRLAGTMASVTAAVEASDRKMASVGGLVDVLSERAKAFDGLEDRLRLLGQDFEQRQSALEAASSHLAQASTVRREAAETAQHLEELSRTITVQVGDAEQRTSTIGRSLDELDARLGTLAGVEKRMTNFESLLAAWEVAQREASAALDQIAGKQATLDAVGSQVKHLFDVAERTSEQLRGIAAERVAIDDARAVLETTREQLTGATSAMQAYVERKWQVDDLDRRLARADALARDVRSSVESLAAQRAVIDRVLERSAALSVQMKQADALAEALRNECAAAAALRSAVDDES